MRQLLSTFYWNSSFLPLLPRPAFFHDLPPAADGQRILRNVVGDAGCRSDVRALANAHRRHQRAVAANENVVVDDGLVLVDAIVIAGDRTSPNVYAGADLRVAQVREMIRLRSLPQLDLFGLNEITDVSTFTDLASWTKMRIRPDNRSRPNLRASP